MTDPLLSTSQPWLWRHSRWCVMVCVGGGRCHSGQRSALVLLLVLVLALALGLGLALVLVVIVKRCAHPQQEVCMPVRYACTQCVCV